jgi:hypothetical protein
LLDTIDAHDDSLLFGIPVAALRNLQVTESTVSMLLSRRGPRCWVDGIRIAGSNLDGIHIATSTASVSLSGQSLSR